MSFEYNEPPNGTTLTHTVVQRKTDSNLLVEPPGEFIRDENEGERHIMRTLKQLSELYSGISDDKLRVWLLRELLSRNLATRDIFSFVEGQEKLRSDIKLLDIRTMTSAMRTKLLDIRRALERKTTRKKTLEEENIEHIKSIQKIKHEFKIKNRKRIEDKKKKYKEKIAHYERKQGPRIFSERDRARKNTVLPQTNVPSNMMEFKDFPIFKTAKDLPKAAKPTGPFVCSKDIVLGQGEITLLSRDPKFSVINKQSRLDFILELEKMLSKHRYKRYKYNKEEMEKIRTVVSESVAELRNKLTMDKITDAEAERKKEINRIWCDSKDRYVFDPISKAINFNDRKATDYKLNKNVFLPKALEPDKEFECEQRRRAFIKVYDDLLERKEKMKEQNITRTGKKEKKNNFRKKTPKSNISDEELGAIKSLKKKIEDGTIVITQTDKSSRFAVMTKSQYLLAGAEHTKKDRAVDWRTVSNIQERVNSHMWWLTNIVGYSKNKEKKRMLKNVIDHGREVPEMILLCKDHKKWDGVGPVPTRPVVSGNKGVNTHLSELLSEILEPVSYAIGGGEIASTEEALSKINYINDTILKHEDLSEIDALNELIQGPKECSTYSKSKPDENSIYSRTEESSIYFRPETDDSSIYSGAEVCSNYPRADVCSNYSRSKPDAMWTDINITDNSGADMCSNYSRPDVCSNYFRSKPDAMWTDMEKITDNSNNAVNVSGALEADTSCNSNEEEAQLVLEILEQLEEEAASSREKSDGQHKITEFFPKLETKRMFFGDNLKEKGHRDRAMSTKDLNESIKHNCIAGLLWRRVREEVKALTKEKEEKARVITLSESPKKMIQDEESEYILVGADVCALYPSLSQVETASLVASAIEQCDVEFSGMDFDMLSLYLYLMLGAGGMREFALEEYIPVKIDGTTSWSLNAKTNREITNWRFARNYELHIQKKMVATMVHIATLVLMQTSLYSFGGKVYQQMSGSGIGLRASACIAKVTMAIWDKEWAVAESLWGLKVHLYFRYIDDLRLYLKAIAKGWWWSDGRWVFDPNIEDHRDPETRTREELQKAFDDVFTFLNFTTESENMFNTGYMPTLDFQTKVMDGGLITYKHYDKEMASNLCIQRGTALSSNTIFSALRQDLCRRLLNTSPLEPETTFVQVVKDYLQRLINSGHRFSFVKAIILQGITRYKYLVDRDSRLPTDPKYLPLYRDKLFKRDERIILKRIDYCTWYGHQKLGDPHRNGWKKYVKRKGDNIKNNRRKSKWSGREVTTTLFVPATCDSELFKKILEKEETVGKDMDWGIKLIEKCGTPIASFFRQNTPIIMGCPFGSECKACSNNTIGCTPKGTVYRATCVECSTFSQPDERSTFSREESDGGSVYSRPGSDESSTYSRADECSTYSRSDDCSTYSRPKPHKKEYTYIGETGRALRTRVREHMRNLHNLSPRSFQIDHWMEHHSWSMTPPEFKFKIVNKFSDALSRQLCEALWIVEEGGLNKRHEFRINELCRMDKKLSDKEKEAMVKREKLEEKEREQKINSFIAVIKRVYEIEKISVPKPLLTSRKRIQYKDQPPTTAARKRRKMEFLTPRQVKTGDPIMDQLELSPIGQPEEVGSQYSSGTSGQGSRNEGVNSKTNVSDKIDLMQILPRPKLTESSEGRSLYKVAARVEHGLKKLGIVRRGNSDSEMVNFSENPFAGTINLKRSYSLPSIGNITLGNLSSDPSFGGNSTNVRGSQEILETGPVGEAELLLSPELEALNLFSPKVGRKRILSPNLTTPLARVRKQATTDDNSPQLRRENINWSLHQYEYLQSSPEEGMQSNVVENVKVDRITLVPRKRLQLKESQMEDFIQDVPGGAMGQVGDVDGGELAPTGGLIMNKPREEPVEATEEERKMASKQGLGKGKMEKEKLRGRGG